MKLCKFYITFENREILFLSFNSINHYTCFENNIICGYLTTKAMELQNEQYIYNFRIDFDFLNFIKDNNLEIRYQLRSLVVNKAYNANTVVRSNIRIE